VILLDEIEKAHPDVFNVLLQVLDDGRLTDGQGRTVNFKDTVLIMTSNVGSHVITAAGDVRDEASYELMKAQVTEALRQTFRPEFLNRIDEIIVFHSLTDEDLARIVDLLVADLARRLEAHDLVLELTPAAKAIIGREGHDPQFGARPLKRAVQRLVENPLARALLEGRFPPGSTIIVDADPVSGTLVFTGSGGEAVVADAAERRDARSEGRTPVGAGAGRSIFDLPDQSEPTGGGERLN
jgi:ATP-dependent Clp protease ATP-binding subunit ClpA